MAIKLPPRPKPLDSTVKRVNADGTPTRVVVDYEAALDRYLAAVAAAIGAS